MKQNKNISLIFLIIGAFVGGGFASGKEILIYFSRFGYYSIVGCVLFGILFYWLTKMFLTLSHKTDNDFCYNCNLFGRQISLKPYLMVCNLVFVGSMLAGIKELGVDWGVLLIAFTVCFVAVVLFTGVNGIEKVNCIFMPLVFVVVFLVLMLNINTAPNTIATFSNTGTLLSSVIYLCFNILTLGMFLLEVGKNYTLTQIKKCSTISAIVLTLVLLIVNLYFVTHFNEVKNYTFPLISLAGNIHPVLSLIVALVVYISMLTTLISSAFTIKEYLVCKVGNKRSIFLVITLGLIISLFGFEKIVSKLYFIIGVIGFLFTVYVVSAKFLKAEKRPKNSTKNS